MRIAAFAHQYLAVPRPDAPPVAALRHRATLRHEIQRDDAAVPDRGQLRRELFSPVQPVDTEAVQTDDGVTTGDPKPVLDVLA